MPAMVNRFMRGANPADLEKWGARVAVGERMTEDRVALTPALLAEDALVFGLRLNDGVDLAEIRGRFSDTLGWAELEAELGRLESAGLLERSDTTIRLTRAGRLLADAVGSELMGVLSNR